MLDRSVRAEQGRLWARKTRHNNGREQGERACEGCKCKISGMRKYPRAPEDNSGAGGSEAGTFFG